MAILIIFVKKKNINYEKIEIIIISNVYHIIRH